MKMNCPACGAHIENNLVIKAAASINGARGRGASKARDPKKRAKPVRKAAGQRADRVRDTLRNARPDDD